MTKLDDPPVGIDDDPLLVELARTPDVVVSPVFRGTSRYRVVRRVGEGGFGVVYEVDDTSANRRLALKLLKRSRGADLEWLKQEFRSMADLVHENLIGFHELVCEGDTWFITMDFVEGVDFLTHVASGSRETEGERQRRYTRLRGALRQLASGVAAIHAAAKIHCDLKPSNVLVDGAGRVVVLDFGLAHDVRRQELMSNDDRVAGTPRYMAPELRAGAVATPASDWYSVGVMLHEALSMPRPVAGCDDPTAVSQDAIDPSAPEQLRRLCAALLDPDPCQRPDAAQILDCLGESAATQEIRAGGRTFVGRGAVISQLHRHLQIVKSGRPSSVFIHGEPGIGKTAACQHFLAEVRAQRTALVLPARCYQRESVPFKALDGVVDALAHELRGLGRSEAAGLMPRDVHLLSRLFPVLEGVPAMNAVPARPRDAPDVQQLRRRAFGALKELLGRLADRQPLIVFIDDLQWSDLDSSRLLVELLGPPDPPALLFIGSYRSSERNQSEALQALLADPSGSGQQLPEIELDRLSRTEAIELAASLVEESDERRLDEVADESGGHPLFLIELMRAHRTRGGRASSLQAVIAERLKRLGQEARSMLELVALAGRPLTQAVCLEAVASGPAGADALRLLAARHLVRTSGPTDGDWVEPYHDRVREAVVEETPPRARRDRHMTLALTLERFDADPETLSEHFDRGGDAGRAGRYAAVAADTARDALAFDRSARLYQLALERLEPSGDERTELLAKLGDALANAGRGADAGRVLLEAAARTPGDGRDLRRRAAEQLLISGREKEGMEVLLPLLRELGISFPKSTLRAVARIMWTGALMSIRGMKFRETPEHAVSSEDLLRLDVLESAGRGLEFHDLWRACAFFNQHTLLSLRVGEPGRAVRGLANLAASLAMSKGMNRRAQRVADYAIATAERRGDANGLQCVYRNIALAEGYSAGNWRAGVEHFLRAEAILSERCVGNTRDLRYCRMKASLGRLRLGELSELADRCDAQLREAIDRGDLLARTALQIYAKAPLLLAADQPERARQMLATSDLPSVGVFRLYHTVTLADAHLYEGDAESAVALWRAWWPEYRRARLGILPLFKLDASRSYAMALVARGGASALELALKLVKTLKEDSVAGMRASRESILACLAERRGERTRASQLLASAASGFDRAGMKLLAAASRRAHGELAGEPQIVEAADAVMRAEGIVRPDLWAVMNVPLPRPSRS